MAKSALSYMTHEEKLLAPAKLNVYLRILGRRADGYHLLDSLMIPVSLYDELTVRLTTLDASNHSGTIEVTADTSSVPDGPENLAFRAAGLFFERVNCSANIGIHIRKRIPVGSGLGGGSSDAAAVLRALNRLFDSPLGIDQLAMLGARIGADVPFFVYGGTARVGGIGERIEQLTLPHPAVFVICSDGYPLSTKDVYSRVDLSLTSGDCASNIPAFISGRLPLENLLTNDLEVCAAQIHPEVLSLKQRLIQEGAIGALMTGSGSAVFGVWPDPQSAGQAAVRLRGSGLWAEAVRALEIAPVSE